jgi:hypothetical protein
MLPIFNSIVSWYFKKRIEEVQRAIDNPVDTQQTVFKDLIEHGAYTEFGKAYGFKSIKNFDDFRNRVPIHDYEDLKPYINKMMNGEQNVLWPSEIKWFAKSSGTTSDKSKFIPVSFEALEKCQFRGGRDMLTFYCHNNPDTRIFEGKGLILGGSHQVNPANKSSYCGDLSAVLMNNLPFWVNLIRTPKSKIALLDDWEIKLEQMAQATVKENVTSISGVPTWAMVLLDRLMEIKGADTMLDIWPNLELYMHGGVSFDPYRLEFQKRIPKKNMHYMESYNASEGFFGIQSQSNQNGMLLMLDYGVYYEFLPVCNLDDENPKTLTLDEVEEGVNYALIISTNAGLWRYMIGDTIEFTSKKPFTFRITGRTKLFINTFGEELMINNAEKAIAQASKLTNSLVRDYTAGPIYFQQGKNAGHEWLLEFDKEPDDLRHFQEILDQTLKNVNSDYEAKRHGDLALHPPQIIVCDQGTFHTWLKTKNKLGGQHKVPRLSNDRGILEEILEIIED